MLYWIYDIPSIAAVALFVAIFLGLCSLGIVLTRGPVRSLLHAQPGMNDTIGDFLQYFGVIYGLLLGLLAVATYQNLSDVDKTVGSEAAALAALYRDVSNYPEPTRSELRALLRDYTKDTIEKAWPQQRKGIIPVGAVHEVADIEKRMVAFRPQNTSEEALHETALRQFNTFFEYRRDRLYSVTAGIPAVLWSTVAVGALINMMLIWLYDLRIGVHLLLGGTISFFLAMMISLIVLMDHPFMGEVSVSPEAFRLVFEELMVK